MNLPKVTLSKGVYQNCNTLFVHFKYSSTIISLLKSRTPARWNPVERVWMLPFLASMADLVRDVLCGVALIEDGGIKSYLTNPDSSSISPSALNQIARMEQWMMARRMSGRTIKVYVSAIRVFLSFFKDKLPSRITNEDVTRFNNEYIIGRNKSASYQNQMINAIKKFFEVTESRSLDPQLIFRPKRGRKLPRVISKEDIKKLLSQTANLKHRTMLSLIYACGLRRGELLSLTLEDIDFNRKVLNIRSAKGNKDRMVPIGDKMIQLIGEYLAAFQPRKWLFEGQHPGELYGERSLQEVMKQAVSRAGISKQATLHWLRHSYATHLHEAGTDIRYIQELLGHSSSKTTEIYTHVSLRNIQQIRSPFDDL